MVLLILAVVAISSIQNDGILSYAQNAANNYNQAVINEQDTLQGYLNFLQNGGLGNGGDNNFIDPDIELLEKYLLGEDKAGRDDTEVFDWDNMLFINEENTIADASTSLIYLNAGPNEDTTKYNIYFKYNNKAYKLVEGFDSYVTESVELIYAPEGREGQTVAYDSNLDGETEEWIIITDRNGKVEIVSANAMGNLLLSERDTRVTATTDLNGDDTVSVKDIAILSYNNVITTINNYCDELVTATDNEGVRSVGGTNNSAPVYHSTNYDEWSTVTIDVASGDMQYEEDLVKLSYLGITTTEIDYWIASRFVYEDSGYVEFSVRRVDGNELSGFLLWKMYRVGDTGSHYGPGYAVRPVVINPEGI